MSTLFINFFNIFINKIKKTLNLIKRLINFYYIIMFELSFQRLYKLGVLNLSYKELR